MAPEGENTERYFQILLKGSEQEEFPPLAELAMFLYDFSLAFKIARLATDHRYDNFQFSDYVLFRNSRPLRQDDQLRLEVLRRESPIELVALVGAVAGAVGSLWVLVQIAEKLVHWGLNRTKLQEEVKKLQRENAKELPTELN